MYWPFLRSKQEEMIALREISPHINNHLIVPIIKPHSAETRVKGQISRVLQTGFRIALIINTNEGHPAPAVAQVLDMERQLTAEYPDQVFPALEVRPEVTSADVLSFVNFYSGRALVFVHRSSHLPSSLFPVQQAVHVLDCNRVMPEFALGVSLGYRVILRDGFNKMQVNGDYPQGSQFDNLVYTYRTYGYNGFGDFGIIGDVPFSRGGGQPSHVALHLTEPLQNSSLWCRHFVSTVQPSTTDVQTKYFDALQRLVRHTGLPGAGVFATQGVSDYSANYAAGSFPGLGSPKRWSMKHHIELVHSILIASGVVVSI